MTTEVSDPKPQDAAEALALVAHARAIAHEYSYGCVIREATHSKSCDAATAEIRALISQASEQERQRILDVLPDNELDMLTRVEQERQRAEKAEAVDGILRSLVWSLHHTDSDGHALYGDDGELQCSGVDGACDFRRASIDDIMAHIHRRGLRLLTVPSAAQLRAKAEAERDEARAKLKEFQADECMYPKLIRERDAARGAAVDLASERRAAQAEAASLRAAIERVRANWPHIEVPDPHAVRALAVGRPVIDPGAPTCLRCKIEEAIRG